jgi:hypothetical protein
VTPFSAQRQEAVAAIRQSAAQEPVHELPPAAALRSNEAVPETPRASYANGGRVRGTSSTLRQAAPSDAWSRFNGAQRSEQQYHQNAQSTYGADRPSYSRPQGSYTGRPATSYGNGGASYRRPASTYARPSGAYTRATPSYGRPAAGYSRPQASRPAPRAPQSHTAPAHDPRR